MKKILSLYEDNGYQPSSVILVGHSMVSTSFYGRMYLQLLVEPLCRLICISEFLWHLTWRTLKFEWLSPGWPNFNGKWFPSISDFRFVITSFDVISLLFIKVIKQWFILLFLGHEEITLIKMRPHVFYVLSSVLCHKK